MTDKCYICGKSRGGKTRKYTCAVPACENNWRGYSHDLKALDNTVSYQARQYGPQKQSDPKNPWVDWANGRYEREVEALRKEWHVHKDAPVRA